MALAYKKHLEGTDPKMGRLVQTLGPFRMKARKSPTHLALIHAIIHQQLSGAAALTISKRFAQLYPGAASPTAHQIAETEVDTLKGIGLSRFKAAYVKNIGRLAVEGRIPTVEECQALTDEEVLAVLTEINGVGRWTAEMVLMFNLGRLDVLPIHDLGVRGGFKIAYGLPELPEPEYLQRYGARWKPYRSVAAWYLWRVADGPESTF